MKLSYFSTATGSAVDRDAGMLRGVSVITEGEAKGHALQIDAKTLEQVKACAETYADGLRVKMDHHTGIDAMVGVLKNFSIDGAQLRADMQSPPSRGARIETGDKRRRRRLWRVAPFTGGAD